MVWMIISFLFFIIFIHAHQWPHYSSFIDCWEPHFLSTFKTLFYNLRCWFFSFFFFSFSFIFFIWRDSIFRKTMGNKKTILHSLIHIFYSPHPLLRLFSKVGNFNWAKIHEDYGYFVKKGHHFIKFLPRKW